MDETELQKIKEAVEEFLQKMTTTSFSVNVSQSKEQEKEDNPFEENFLPNNSPARKDHMVRLSYATETADVNSVAIDISLQEPQFLIGQSGQTLFDLQWVLKIMLNKKLQKPFYVKVDINGYKKKKVEYLKNLARELADEVSSTRQEKVLNPMPAYERRIVHMELSQRRDVATESRGTGPERHLVIKPR